MSNYLNNLVAKTLNRTEVVHPRLTSLFEPLHPSWPAPEGELNSKMGHGEQISSEKAVEDSSPAQQPVVTQLPETIWEVTHNVSNQPLNNESVVPSEKPNKPIEARSEQPNKAKFELSSLQPGEASSESTSSQTPRTVVQTSEDRPSIESTQQQVNPDQPILNTVTYRNQKDPTLIRSAAVRIEPNVSLLWKRGNADEQESRPVHEPISPYPEPSPIQIPSGTVVIQPQVTPYRELALPHPEEPTAMKESIPSIQVTIGRIEVRAIPPPPSKPKKQHPQPSVMSLDEYLHQRAKGGKP